MQQLQELAAAADDVPLEDVAEQLEALAKQMRLACNTGGAHACREADETFM